LAIDERGLFWWHSIRLPDGTFTPGERTPGVLEQAWDALHLPSLVGKSVLDVGAWDGWYSFRAESEGAARVVALDSYVWSLDFARSNEYWEYVRASEARGERYDLWGPDCAFWDAESLPGKTSFDLASSALNSGVESVVADFVQDDLSGLGTFDVALFLGVLYHLREPLLGLERLRSVTRELAVIETAAIRVEGQEEASLVEFISKYQANFDPTTWYVPTERALFGMCDAAGFSSIEIVDELEVQSRGRIRDYRLTLHARP
jgi:tRNA (mo5U34)-methyltransferase